MNNHLIIGLDLSLNSTGMTMITNSGIEFHRFVYDKEPRPIENLFQHKFTLPTNVNINDIVDETDFYSEDQAQITLRIMVIVKRITKIIREKIAKRDIKKLYVNIEGFIMSEVNGHTQLRILGGLIMLQGLVRSELIKIKLENNFEDFKIFVTSPSNLKLYFTGDGFADKQLMLDNFINIFDGNKLLPDTSSLAKVNDIIDSFALAVNCHHRIYHNESFMRMFENKIIDGKLFKKVKPKKKSKTKTKVQKAIDSKETDLIRNSINL